MRRVFVETNWVVAYAAPAHHRSPAALKLLDRAANGEIKLYLPVICIAEARRPIFERFQSRNEADRVRQFLSWARDTGAVDAAEDEATRRVLDRMEGREKADLDQLDDAFGNLKAAVGMEIFNLSQEMLERCAALSYLELTLNLLTKLFWPRYLFEGNDCWRMVWTRPPFVNWIPISNPGTKAGIGKND